MFNRIIQQTKNRKLVDCLVDDNQMGRKIFLNLLQNLQ